VSLDLVFCAFRNAQPVVSANVVGRQVKHLHAVVRPDTVHPCHSLRLTALHSGTVRLLFPVQITVAESPFARFGYGYIKVGELLRDTSQERFEAVMIDQLVHPGNLGDR
jgi:hypothetical protein